MLEVVFEQGVAGGLKIAKSSRPGDKWFSVQAGIYPEGTPAEFREPPRQKTRTWTGLDLGGGREDVAPLLLALSVGDLSGLLAGGTVVNRKTVLEHLEEAWGEDALRCLDESWDTSMETLRRLREAGSEPVRVWAAPWCPDDLCGVYFVCDLLRDMETPMSVVWAPRESVRRDGVMVEIRGLGEVNPEELGAMAAGAVELEPNRRRAYADRWRELAAENAPLRAVVNGRLSSVPEDFYDFALRAALTEEPVKMGKVLAGALATRPGVGDGGLYRRLQVMRAAGEVREAAPGDGKHPSSAMLQRVK